MLAREDLQTHHAVHRQAHHVRRPELLRRRMTGEREEVLLEMAECVKGDINCGNHFGQHSTHSGRNAIKLKLGVQKNHLQLPSISALVLETRAGVARINVNQI